MDKYRVMVVEDDEVLAQGIQDHLEKWGYEVACVRDFRNVMGEFASFQPHLVLLDIGLPFYNGHYWCAQIRQVSQIPVIFVSAAGDNMNIVMAVNMGGDDFITKPFAPEVLSAKVQAMIRRSYAFQSRTNVVEYGGLILDMTDATVLVAGQKAELTRNEFRILELLLERAGQVVAREEIMERLWDNDCFVDDNTLTVNMTRLRRKLEALGAEGLIHTRKGLGYALLSDDGGKEES